MEIIPPAPRRSPRALIDTSSQIFIVAYLYGLGGITRKALLAAFSYYLLQTTCTSDDRIGHWGISFSPFYMEWVR